MKSLVSCVVRIVVEYVCMACELSRGKCVVAKREGKIQIRKLGIDGRMALKLNL
jgi:hypothetical protein